MANDRGAISSMNNETRGRQRTELVRLQSWSSHALSLTSQQLRAARDLLDQASRPAKIESQKHFIVPCSHRVYTFCWGCIFLMHVMLVVFCSTVFAIHIYAIDPYSWFQNTLPSLGHTFDNNIGYVVIASMGLFGLQHTYVALKMIYYSFRARGLTLRPVHTKLSENKVAPSDNHSTGVRTSLQKRFQVFSVKGRYYDLLFDIREIIEISLQCRQAYYLSYFLPTPWLNTFSVAIVVINCWTTPLFRYLLRKNLPLERLVCLLIDLCLDFSSSILIPCIIFWPYYRNLNMEIWYSSTWVIKTNSEIGLIIINAWASLLSLILPQWSMINCLTSIAVLIERQSKYNTRESFVPRSNRPAVSSTRKKSLQDNKEETEQPKELEDWMIQMRTSKKTILLHVCLFVLGCVILIIALAANFAQNDSVSLTLQKSCLSEVHPWFSNKYSCAVLLIDGDFNELSQGCNANELEALLAQVSPITLASLTFSNCKTLEIPRILQSFHQLFWLEIYRSHLMEWSEEAALTELFHPRLNLVYVVHTTFEDPSTLPEGLMHTPPPSLKDIEIFDTNLNALPENLDEIWTHPIDYLYLERSNLVRIPSCFARMSISVVSFAGNLIETLENLEFEEGQSYYYMSFTNNSMLSILPESFYNATFGNLYLPFTKLSSNISELPSWILDPEYISTNQITVFGTPFCEDRLLPLFEQEVLESEEEQQLFELVNGTLICEPVDENDYIFFPYDLYDEIRKETESQLSVN